MNVVYINYIPKEDYMSKLFLTASLRDALGTNRLKKLRSSGQVPGILYGGHMDPTAISVNKLEMDKFLAENNVGSKVYVNLEGKEIMAFVKAVQKDVFGLNLLNVDLQALTKTDKVKMFVRLNFVGKDKLPIGAISQELASEIEVETFPDQMIDTLNVDVANLQFGDTVKVSDLPIMNDENFRIFTSPDLTLFTLIHSKAQSDAEEGETEATEPVTS
jgi:ribosomal protein L25, Ctc-form